MPEVLTGILFLGGIIGLAILLPGSVHEILGSIMDFLWYIGVRLMFWVPMLLWFSTGVAIALLVVAILVPPLKMVGEDIVEFARIGADLTFLGCIWVALSGVSGEWQHVAIGVGAFLVLALWYDYGEYIL